MGEKGAPSSCLIRTCTYLVRVFLKFCLPKRVIRLIRGFVFLLIVVSSGSVAGGRRLLFSVIFFVSFFL